MKRSWLISFLTLILMLVSCGGTDRVEVSRSVVDPTCLTEGYTEHTYSDGYVCRDTFVDKIDHDYIDFTIGEEKYVYRSMCRFCGKEKLEYIEEEISTEVVINRNRKKPVFTGYDVIAVAMIIERTPDDAIRAIRRAEKHGAYGFMIYVSCLDFEYRTLEHLERIMYSTDLPVLAIAYSVSLFQPQSLSYDDMVNLLKLSVQAGACAVDLQAFTYGDFATTTQTLHDYRSYWEEKGFDMSFANYNPKEVCADPAVLAKQKVVIDEIHALGAEVLLSVHANVSLPAEQTLALGKFIEAQGVDVVKIVLGGSSKETVVEHLKAIIAMDKEMKCKFSVHGQSTLSRLMGPMFGSYIAFCVDEYTPVETNIQIDLETMVAILNSPELKGNN